MTNLDSLHTMNIAMAGAEFNWDNCQIKNGVPSGAEWRGYKAIMLAFQDNRCAACGERFTDSDIIEVCHIVAAQGKWNSKRGYVGGNVYLGHKECNKADAIVFGSIVPIWSLIDNGALVLPVRPTRGECLAADVPNVSSNGAYDRRLAARMMSKP